MPTDDGDCVGQCARSSPKASLAHKSGLAAAIGIVLVLAAGGVGIYLERGAQRTATSELVSFAPAQSSVQSLLSLFIDEETGERGYVITGQLQFLQPYNMGLKRVPSLFSSLDQRLKGQSHELRLLAAIRMRYSTWLNGFAVAQINDVNAGRRSGAIAEEGTGRGRALFDDLRARTEALGNSLATDGARLTRDIEDANDQIFWLIVAMTTCALIGAFLASALVKRWITDPIRHLEREVLKVGAGDFDHRLELVGPREIASLASETEAMRQRLRNASTENQRLLDDVRFLQGALLPQRIPQTDGFRVTGRYLPGAAGHVGGDWYNVRSVDDNGVFFAVGDVAGHGTRAAADMAMLRFGINAHAAVDPNPADVLDRLAKVRPDPAVSGMATVLCGLFDGTRGTLRCASAGHLNPVLVQDGVARQITVPPGLPIGVRTASSYTGVQSSVDPGSILIAFTDGLVERHGEVIDVGIERLVDAATADLKLDDLLDHLIEVLLPDGAKDDVALLGVQFLAP